MGQLSAFLLQRRMAQFFVEHIKGRGVIEVFLEDIAAHLNVMPDRIVWILASRRRRESMQRMCVSFGQKVLIRYQPGVIWVFAKE
jgi:hypothetical protein